MPKTKSKKQQRKRPNIGFMINEFDGRYPGRLMPLAMRYAADNDVNLIIFPGGALESRVAFENHQNVIYDFVNRNNLDALVIATGTLSNFVGIDKFRAFLERFKGIPIVSISIKLEGFPSILIDNRAGVAEMIDHMVTVHNYRRIAFIRGASTNLEAIDRYQAYLDTLKAHRIPFDPGLVVQGDFTPLSGNAAMLELIEKRKVQFDAVVAANDEMAIGALDELAARDIRVPQDVAVAGFDNIEGAEFNPTPLTTVEQPISEQGMRAIDLAIQILRGRKVPETLYMPTRLIIRSSCGCFGQSRLITDDASAPVRTGKKRQGISSGQAAAISETIRKNIGDSNNDPRSVEKWISNLLDVISSGVLTEENTHQFITRLSDILNEQMKKGRNIKIWQDLLPMMENSLFGYFRAPKALQQLNVLFQKSREIVEDTIRKEQRLYEIELNVGYTFVNETMQRIISNLTVEEMKKTILDHFPRIGIHSAYICLYVGDTFYLLDGKEWQTPPHSELLLGFTDDRDVVPDPKSRVFPTVNMLPRGVLPSRRRHTLLVKPLFFMNEHLGYIIFEIPDRHSIPNQSYETLRIQISGSIKSAFLFSMSRRAENQLKEANKKLTDANEKLHELDKAKTNFFANISHEIRTPLTLILSPLESIVTGHYGPSLDIRDSKLQSMMENGLRLLKLINNLLDFSKIEAGRMTVNRRRTNVSHLLDYYVKMVRPSAESRKLFMWFVDNTPGVVAWIDRDLIEKAVFNLLSNALKFTPEGGDVIVQLDQHDREFSISVRDTGIGIPQDKLKDIFERFGQLDNEASRKYDGTGIGLAFAKEIVQLHGGGISVRSRPGQGSVFVMTLPVGEKMDDGRPDPTGMADEIEADREIRPSMLAGFAARKEIISGKTDAAKAPRPELKTVLVADDNTDMRNFLVTLLDREYNVLQAANGLEALEIVNRDKPDIVLTDVMMPELDGYELTRAIKTSEELKTIPVILVTAKADISMKLEGLGYGADDYIAKPFNSRELFVRIHNLLKARELQTELVKKQKEIDSDIQQAALVQKVILTPESALARISGLEVDIGYLPMNGKISGDYYNISPLRGGIASLMIADAAGHGIQAALSTMQIDLLAKESVEVPQPNSRIHYINRMLTEKIMSKNFFTVFLAHLYPDRIAFASAAHPSQYLIRSTGEVIPLKTRGKVVGMLTDCSYEMSELPVSRGDKLFLFTDGIFEEFSADGTEFGEERLLEFLRTEGRDLAPAELNAQLLRRVREYTGRKSPNDDITLICARVK